MVVTAFVYLALALAVGIVVVALRMPALGVSFQTSGLEVEVSEHGRLVARLSPGARVEIKGSHLVFAGSAGELAPDYTPDGGAGRVRSWYAQRRVLARIADQRPVRLKLPGERAHTLGARSRSLLDLSVDVWLLLMQGAVIGTLGVWLLAVRGPSRGGGAFALSCLGVFCAAYSGAMFDAREVAAAPQLLRSMEALNEVGSNVGAAGLAALFLSSPRALVGVAVQRALFAVAVALGVLRTFDIVPLSAFYLGLLALNACTLAALAAQWVTGREDPAARAMLRWIGAVTFVGIAGLGLAMAGPVLIGLPSLGGDGLSFIPLFFVYGGIAFGLGGHRMFDLDRWHTG